MKRISFTMILFFICANFYSQSQIIKIWDGTPAYSKVKIDTESSEIDDNGIQRIYNITEPTLEYYPPQNNPSGAAVIVCPGGGYKRLAYTFEGIGTAKMFSELGIAAFILKYRQPDDNKMIKKEIVPLSDVQMAIKHVRQNSVKYKINPSKIGIIGFSAGGHLAATASTKFEMNVIPNSTKFNLRPDYSILIYPVISLQKRFTHGGSRNNLLGENPSDSIVNAFSNEMNVTSSTPITFLIHASDDKAVPVENSIRYYEACIKNNVPVTMHIFEKGGHGFAMKNGWLDNQWVFLLKNWLNEHQLILP